MNRELDKLEQVFTKAVQLSSPEEQAAYLDKACIGDPDLRERVGKLINANSGAGGFLRTDDQQESDPATVLGTTPLSESLGSVIGDYKLLQRLGEGGFGVVYMAEQTKPVLRRVALKIIKLGMDTKQVIGRFEAERQALAMMEHPNIAKVLFAGSTDTGRPYFVMELVRGIPITEYCDQNDLSTKERLELFAQVCHAVQHAHQKGIIHRDLKPSNVLITLHDGIPVPKVIDFGIAKATQQKLTDKTVFTQLQQFVGTPAYMSPEQAEMSGLDIDTRSDIYSLGVMLYELLAGKTPFESKDLLKAGIDAMRQRLREVEPPKPSNRLSTLTDQERTAVAKHRRSDPKKLSTILHGELDWIVMKALEKDRTRRYETANGFALDIKRYLNNEPVTAVAPSAVYKFQKFARRNKVALATGTAFAVLLIVGIISTGAFAYLEYTAKNKLLQATEQLQEETNRAEQAEQTAKNDRDRALGAEKTAKQRLNEARLNLYQADIPGAHLAVREENTIRARKMLSAHVPQSEDEEDFRGFEWRYLWAQTSTLLNLPPTTRILKGHTDLVHPRDFSPDNTMLVSGGRDGQAIVWDRATGQLLHRLQYEEWIDSVVFSRDSRLIALLSGDTISLWDVSGKTPHLQDEQPSFRGASFNGRPYGRRIRFSPIRDLLAYDQPPLGDETDYRVVLYDYTKKKTSLTLTNAGTILDISPDGKLLATGTSKRTQHTVMFWDLSNQGNLIRTHTNFLNAVNFSRSGKKLITYDDDGVHAWDLNEVLSSPSDRLVSPKPNAGEFIEPGNISPDGTEIVEKYSREGLLIKPANWTKQTNAIPNVGYNFTFSPDGKMLAIKRLGQQLELFHASKMKSIRTFDQVSPKSVPLCFGPSGNPLFAYEWRLTEGKAGTLSLIDVPSGTVNQERNFERFHKLSVSADGRLVAMLFKDGTLSILNSQNLQTHTNLVVADHVKGNSDVRFSPDGKWLAAVADHRSIKLFDTRTWRAETIPDQHYIVGFIDEGRRFLSWTTQGQLYETNLETGAKKERFKATGGHVTFAISPDEKTLVTGGWWGDVEFWNIETGRRMMVFDIEARVFKVKFSPDGNMLLAHEVPPERAVNGEFTGTLHYWKAPSFNEIETSEEFIGEQGSD